MGAWYTWIEMNRITGPGNGTFFAWLEGGSRGVLIGKSTPAGTACNTSLTLEQAIAQFGRTNWQAGPWRGAHPFLSEIYDASQSVKAWCNASGETEVGPFSNSEPCGATIHAEFRCSATQTHSARSHSG
jgi:hypothetical protein